MQIAAQTMAENGEQGSNLAHKERAPGSKKRLPDMILPLKHSETGTAKDLSLYQRFFVPPFYLLSQSDFSKSSVRGLSTPADSSHAVAKLETSDQNGEEEATDFRLNVDEKESGQKERRKAFGCRPQFLSRRSLVISLLVITLLVAVLLPVLLTQLHKTRHEYGDVDDNKYSPTAQLSPSSASDSFGFAFSDNPLRLAILANFPDPSIHYDPGTSTWFAYATNPGAGILHLEQTSTVEVQRPPTANIQVAKSSDFITWTFDQANPDALPDTGAWVRKTARKPTANDNIIHSHTWQDLTSHQERSYTNSSVQISNTDLPLANVWAPDVIQHPARTSFLLYYSAISAADSDHHHCVGVATATSMTGPYAPAETPLVCTAAGAIDPIGVIDPDDDDAIYVAYKIDGNSNGHGGECNNMVAPQVSTPIMLQKMQADGVNAAPGFEPVQLLDRTDIDGPLIEAPSLIKASGLWFLFYSSGCTSKLSYDVRYATATNITGPYIRRETPLLRTGDFGLRAPGSVSIRWMPHKASNNSGNSHSSISNTPVESSVESVQSSNTTSGGSWRFAVHARTDTRAGGIRAMFLAELAFDGEDVALRLVDA